MPIKACVKTYEARADPWELIHTKRTPFDNKLTFVLLSRPIWTLIQKHIVSRKLKYLSTLMEYQPFSLVDFCNL